MINLYQLQLFLAVVDRGTFSAAAVELNLTQPAISLQVRALEDRYNVRLFNRQGQRLELTEAGQAFVEPARRLVALSKEVEEGLRVGQGFLKGKINLACSTTAVNALYILSPLLAGFRLQANDVQFSLQTVTEETAVQMLLDLNVQFAIISASTSHKFTEAYLLDSDPLVLVTPLNHSWQGNTIELESLRGEAFIHYSAGSEDRRVSDTLLRMNGLGPEDLVVVGEVDNAYAAAELVRNGIGFAFLHSKIANRIPDIGIAHFNIPSTEKDRLFRRETWLVRYAPTFERKSAIIQNQFWEFVCQNSQTG